MPRKRNTNHYEEYIAFGKPNHERLAELVLLAKGEDLNLSQFAKLCGVSTSTLTRIVNREIKGRISDELIYKMCENTKSDVKADDFLKANGKVSKTMMDVHLGIFGTPADGKKQYFFDFTNTEKRIHLALEAIKEDLEQREVQYDSIHICQDIIMNKKLRFLADFVIEFENATKWAIDVHNPNRSLMSKIIEIFGTSYLESFKEKRLKVSIITDEKDQYQYVKERFSETMIRDDISIILVDLQNKRKLDEFHIPMKN